MSSGQSTNTEFVFRKNDEIGAAAAEDDKHYLRDCFIDNGELSVLLDCDDPKRVVVGRTGAGKTALLGEVENSAREVIVLSPHSLSLNYIANNTLIRFFEDAGVNLSPFYGLLWKHIIVVELLKAKFQIRNEDSQRIGMQRLRQLLSKDHIKEQAVDYLEKWGNKFWLTSEERMHELTNRIQSSLEASLSADAGLAKAAAGGGKNLSSEQKKQIVERGKQAVSEVQIRELENLISILDEAIFTDRQQHFYVTIDTLDEEWADDRIRFSLIKALIDTVRRFRKVSNIKIIIALRQDLLDKVLHSTRDPGFQEEKYESLYMYVSWNKKQLRTVIETRLNSLVKRRYTNENIRVNDLFPNSIDRLDPLEYILSRTFLRPRDAILFINDCIAVAEGQPGFTAATVKTAEEEYSHKRLQSLATEWHIVHPNLKAVVQMFCGMKEHFPLSEISSQLLCERYERVVGEIADTDEDPITASLDKMYTKEGNFETIRNTVVRTLHFVGLFGIKIGATSSVNWVYNSRLSLAPGQLRGSSIVYIHPMFYRALDVRMIK